MVGLEEGEDIIQLVTTNEAWEVVHIGYTDCMKKETAGTYYVPIVCFALTNKGNIFPISADTLSPPVFEHYGIRKIGLGIIFRDMEEFSSSSHFLEDWKKNYNA